MLSVGSLFTGVYGIELGLERTGYFHTVWMVENDEFCQKILRKHHPEIPLYGDIKEIEWSTMPQVDMLTGGFPCQDISTANPKGKGIDGSRSGLWKEYAKAIGELRPKYALIENVPAIVRKGLNIVLADLTEAGYDAEWFDLRASDFGALHKRERIFIVALDPDQHEQREVGEVRQGQTPAVGRALKNTIAHTHGNGQHRESLSIFSRESRQDNPRDKNGIITHDLPERAQRFWQKKVDRKRGFSWCQDVGRVEDLQGRPDIPEPLFRGARDGVPDWVDRIKALGNAVVPDCAEFIGELIMKYDKMEAFA